MNKLNDFIYNLVVFLLFKCQQFEICIPRNWRLSDYWTEIGDSKLESYKLNGFKLKMEQKQKMHFGTKVKFKHNIIIIVFSTNTKMNCSKIRNSVFIISVDEWKFIVFYTIKWNVFTPLIVYIFSTSRIRQTSVWFTVVISK